jgi:hypothetical protein
LLHKLDFDFKKGRRDPFLGWYSPSYGLKQESGVLSCLKKGFSQEVAFTTAICIHSSQEIKTLSKRFSKIEQQIEDS